MKAPNDESEYGEYGQGELERKSRYGRLTEYEKRLLDRMRKNRAGGGLRVGGVGGGRGR